MCRGREARGKIEDVLDVRGAEGVDRLGVVADYAQAVTGGFEREQDLRLQAVGVLVLVDQDVIEKRAHVLSERPVPHERVPVKEQIVEVEHLLRELRLDIATEQGLEVRLPLCAPGEGV